MKKRLLVLLLVILLTAGVISAGFVYFGFVSQTIYEESTAHLSEIFHQANQTLYNLVSVNWSRMRMWVPYLEKTGKLNLMNFLMTRIINLATSLKKLNFVGHVRRFVSLQMQQFLNHFIQKCQFQLTQAAALVLMKTHTTLH